MEGDGHTHELPARNVLLWALGVTVAYAAFESFAGWWSGSLALLSDAGHMVTDSASLGLAALASWLARKPPSARHSYGFGRAEIVAALVNAVSMLAVIAGICIAAIGRLRNPQPVSGESVAIVALFGLIVNVAVGWILARGEKSMNARGALLHVLADLLGSIAALLSGLVIWYTGWFPIDPLLSIAICALILVSTFRLLRDALHALMEGVPFDMSLDEIGQAIASITGVRSVHDLHIWTLSSNRAALSAHIVVDHLHRWDDILHDVTAMLVERFGIEHATLQPERRVKVLSQMPKPK